MLNDNGGTNNDTFGSFKPQFGPFGTAGMTSSPGPRYADSSKTTFIPQIKTANKFNYVAGDSSTNSFECSVSGYTEIQSRLWAYDVADNKAYYVGSMPTEGSDVGMGNSTFITGCEYGIGQQHNLIPSSTQNWYCGLPSSSCRYTNLTLNQYSYNFSDPTSATSFSRIAIKTYRVVDGTGQLIGMGNTTTAANSGAPSYGVPANKSLLGTNYLGGHAGIGNAIGYISDTEVLVDDRAGNIWYVNLEDYWMGSNVWSSENATLPLGATAHPNTPGTYTQLTEPAIGTWPGPGHTHNLENGWAVCSQLTNNRVYTVIAKKVIDINYPFFQNGGNVQPVRTQGDLTFIASDVSQNGQPTVAITIDNQSAATTLMPLGKSVVKYPIDLDNFIVSTVPMAQSPANPITGAVVGAPQTPSGSVAIVKEPATTNYYLIAQRQRYLAAISEEAADTLNTLYSPINVDSIGNYIDYEFWWDAPNGAFQAGSESFESGLITPTTFGTGSHSGPSGILCTTGVQQLNFRGGSQPPDCVFPSSYTYDCTINGCQSVFSSTTVPPGQFLTLAACTGECRSYSCNTTNYSCSEIPGTGATNTFLLDDDCDEFCVPSYYDCSPAGCISASSASHTYTALTDCQAECYSYNCEDTGCFYSGGTGGTYTSMTECTASCFSYVCGDDGAGNPDCTLFNPPYYGTGGTFTAATLADAYSACTAATATSVCTSWACNFENVAPNTDIYVYYDTTSMSLANSKTAHNSIMAWTNSIPNWTGNIYHVNMADERWLNWAGIPFQQPTPRGLRATSSISMDNNGLGYSSSSYPAANYCPRPLLLTAWGQSQPNGANWYDGFDPAIGNIYISSGSLSTAGGAAGTYQFRGYPPYAGGSFTAPDYSVPVLNVLFTDESDSQFTGSNPLNYNEFGNTQIYYDVDRVSNDTPSFTAVSSLQPEPTPPFISDYNYYMGVWNSIVANSGSIANFVYPTKPVNYSYWGSGTVMVFKHQALSVLAAISSGNKNNFIDSSTGLLGIQDGLFSAGTAPRMASAGGTLGGTPGLCSIANLTQLETSNPYWDSGFGGLDQYGFGCNVSFPVINASLVQTDLEGFLDGGSSILATGCTSAATSTNTNFPYTSETQCLDICDPKWECTDNGCILNSTGGTFDSYSACTGGTVMMVAGIMTDVPGCQSWSCTTVGCETYNSPLGGTGGTYTSISECNGECTSWNCDYVPYSMPWTTDGCVEYLGTGQTYTSDTACQRDCISWDCSQTTPCTQYPNTAQTYSTEALCTASTACAWYQCQAGGCIQQTGAFVAGLNNYATEAACKTHCVGWGCPQSSISNDTNIYVYYDSYYDMDNSYTATASRYNAVMAWVNSIPGHTGTTYHTVIQNQRWLDWANVTYSGVSSSSQIPRMIGAGPLNLGFKRALKIVKFGSTTSDAANWYDDFVAGQTETVPGIGTMTTKGLPPTAHTSGNTLIICFVDENSGSMYASGAATGGGTVGQYTPNAGCGTIQPIFSCGTQTAGYQPTTGFTQDYTAYTNTYNAVTAATGTTLGFVFPTQMFASVSNLPPGTPLNGGLAEGALNLVASISSGDQSVPDGTWLNTTYPRLASQGGTLNGTPPLCEIADLQILSVTNPYYSGGTGNLEAKGWGYSLTYPYTFSSTGFQDELTLFLSQSNTSASAGICISAETLWSVSTTYPYSCETCTTSLNCCDCNCSPTQDLYACSDTGCTLSPLGTMTWDQCNNPNFETSCTSYSCHTNTGCHQYNYPNPQMLIHNGLTSAPVGAIYPNPVGGTGGTFTGGNALTNCNKLCTSFNCVWDPNNMSITQDGCLQQVGTGGTYYNELQQSLDNTDASYSACTGVCISFECNNPCGTVSYPIPLPTGNPPAPVNPVTGCTEYPNTGSTHLTEIACTASCEEHWYCYTGAGTTFLANCLNATSTGISNSSFEGQISAIANNSTWQTMQLANLRWDMTGNLLQSSPGGISTLPLPPNPCEGPLGHWARIISVSYSVLNFQPYYSWSTFIDAVNAVGSTSPPLTYASTWPDVIQSAGPHIFAEWEWCTCETEDCKIGCIDELPLPAQTHGAYTSSTAATEVCCTGATATTWSCTTSTQANTCDGLTLLPITYSNPSGAYDYMSLNFGYNTFSGYHYESTTPPPNSTGCTGPNGGQLFKLTGITLNNSSLSNTNYTSWGAFITACQAIPAPDGPILGLIVGMSVQNIEAQIQSYSAFCSSYIQYGTTECVCTNTPCNCLELTDGTGPYTSQTECQEVCCNSGTSWNCQNGIPYTPQCTLKDYIGMYNSDMNVLDYFRTNSATTQFGLSKVILATPVVPGTNPLTWAQVQSNMGTAFNWADCYYNLPGTQNFYPYQYIANISHPAVNGGVKYNTWTTFSGAATTAGVSFNSTDTVLTVCGKIDLQLGSPNQGCLVESFNCCRQEQCYCYEIFSGGGTYNTQIDCQPICCPPPPMGWDCTMPQPPATIGTCNYMPYGLYATWAQCIVDCTGTTSWDCVPGIDQVVGIDSVDCGPAMTELLIAGVPAFNAIAALQEISSTYPTSNYDQFYFESSSSSTGLPDSCINPTTGNKYQNTPKPSWGNYTGSIYQYSPTIAGNNWVDFTNNLNTIYQTSGNGSQATTTPFSGLDRVGASAMMCATCPNYGVTWTSYIPGNLLGASVSNCTCIVVDCDCVEVSGNQGQYPTYSSCIPPCCQVVDATYDCTITGCIDPGGGYGEFQGAAALQDCEDVCYEWVCNNQNTQTSNCLNLIPLEFFANLQYIYAANNMPYNNLPFTNAGTAGGFGQWVQTNNPGNVLIDFFGNPLSLVAPYDVFLNSVTGEYNMQEQNVTNYKMDTTTSGPTSLLTGATISNYCNSPHGKWWKPTGMGIVDRDTGVILITPQVTWYALIKLLVVTYPAICTQMGFPSGTPNPQPCITDMLGKQPHLINFSLLSTPVGFATLNGEFRLYGEGCVC